jgi:cytochrome b561
MALGILFMMFSVFIRLTMKDTPLYEVVWPFHYQVGFLILVFGAIRLLWLVKRLITRSDPHTDALARVGHYATMYALMITIPSLILLRSYGEGRGFKMFGIQFFEANEDVKVDFLVYIGEFHGILGFTLFAMIVGHILATIRHHRKGNKVLKKIT